MDLIEFLDIPESEKSKIYKFVNDTEALENKYGVVNALDLVLIMKIIELEDRIKELEKRG